MFSFSNHCKCFLFLTISNVFFFIFISNVHHHRHPSSDTFLPTPVINLRPYGACQTMMSQWMYLRNTGRSPLLLPFCFCFLLYLEVDSINFYQFSIKSDFIPYCHCIIGICIQKQNITRPSILCKSQIFTLYSISEKVHPLKNINLEKYSSLKTSPP